MKKLLLILLLSLCFGVAIAQSRLSIGVYGEATYTRMFYSNNYKRYTNADLYRNAPSVGQFDLPHVTFNISYDFVHGLHFNQSDINMDY